MKIKVTPKPAICQTLIILFLGTALTAQVTRDHTPVLKNWPAPLYWQPSVAESDAAAAKLEPAIRPPTPDATTPPGSLVFVAMTPCRVVDTRATQAFPNPFGPPSLVSGSARSFPIQSSALCTIPANAMAYSFNVTVIPPGSLGFLTIWPEGQSQPNAVTLDDVPGDIRNNAAIVPAGTPNGGISVITNAATDLVIDINGYYTPSTGVTLAQGTAGAPSLSFAGDPTTGIFSTGTGSVSLTTGGTAALTVDSTGDVELPGSIRKGGNLFLHNLGTYNTATGVNALSTPTTGTSNTATGYQALQKASSGSDNTAIGTLALGSNQDGGKNTAVGSAALQINVDGGDNTALGYAALQNARTSYNTAIGFKALIGSYGNFNTALGYMAGFNIETGANNIDIGNQGAAAGESGKIRIGTAGTQTAFFAAGISGVMTGGAGTAVVIDSNGQLGTVSSSRRYKEDIEDMADASNGLLRLRPVKFRYTQPYADGSKPLDYGLIAEEVAEVYPDLVVKGADGQVETVQYHKLAPMLLNELQKEHTALEQERETVRTLNAAVDALQAQVSGLQKALDILGAAQPRTRQ